MSGLYLEPETGATVYDPKDSRASQESFHVRAILRVLQRAPKGVPASSALVLVAEGDVVLRASVAALGFRRAKRALARALAAHAAGVRVAPEPATSDDDSWASDPSRYIQRTAETCPGRPCGADCDHRERKEGR